MAVCSSCPPSQLSSGASTCSRLGFGGPVAPSLLSRLRFLPMRFVAIRLSARFFRHLGACRRRTPRTRVDLRVDSKKKRPRRTRRASDATLRNPTQPAPRAFAVGVRRRDAKNRSAIWSSASRNDTEVEDAACLASLHENVASAASVQRRASSSRRSNLLKSGSTSLIFSPCVTSSSRPQLYRP